MTTLRKNSRITARNALGVGCTAMLALALTGCGAETDPVAPSPSATVPPPSTAPAVPGQLLVTFEDLAAGEVQPGSTIANSGSGPATGTLQLGDFESHTLPSVVAGNDPGGQALLFTSSCSDAAACTGAIVEFEADQAWTPGGSNFSYGASVLVQPSDVGEGSNIVQLGYSTDGNGQWKLQIDDEAGHPTCVLVSTTDGESVVARSEITVADGEWHELECRRGADSLEIVVDGEAQGVSPVSPSLRVSPLEAPLRIGGKNLKPANDPFFGTLDDVFLQIED